MDNGLVARHKSSVQLRQVSSDPSESGMHSLQKPVGGNLMSRSPALCFGVNDGSDGGKLKTNSDIVEEAGRLLRVRSPRGSSGTEVSQLGSRQPKGMFNGRIASLS